MSKNMPQMARNGKNQYGEPKEKIICLACSIAKRQHAFSRIDKYDASKGFKSICKDCSKNKILRERERRKNNWKYKPALTMLNNSKQRAKNANIEHTLTLEDIVIPDKCPILGIELQTGDRKTHANAPSIDRICNEYGYTKDNIMIISCRANILKRDATIDELIKLGEFFKNFKENKN